MKPCLFCRIASRGVESFCVFEDSSAVGFLDHRPLFPGHVLLVPRSHHETLADLPEARILPFFGAVKLLTRAVEIAMEADGSLVAVNNRVSQSVPHLHVHIIPRRRKDGLRGFFWPRHPYPDEEEMGRVQEAIRAAVSDLAAGKDR